MDAIADWVWFGGGGALGLSAIALLYWALLQDRSRGRRRCPRCWYDMSGSPTLVCSECGYAAKHEGKLFKTRRRWRGAAMGLVVAMLALGSALYPSISSGRWPSLIPTTALVLISEQFRNAQPKLRDELESRLKRGAMWDWQVRILCRRAIGSRAQSAICTIQLHTRESWPTGVSPTYVADASRIPTSAWWFDSQRLKVRISPRGPSAEATVIVLPAVGRRSPTAAQFDRLEPHTLRKFPSLNWKAAHALLPERVPGDHVVEFDVAISVSVGGADSPPRWVRVWNERTSLGMTIDGELVDHLAAIESENIAAVIQSELWVVPLESSIRVVRTFGAVDDLHDDGALGLRFELMRGDEVLARTDGWWRNNTACRDSEYLPWDWSVPNLREALDAARRDGASHEWRMRVSGDGAIALRAFDDRSERCPPERRYWKGVIDVPLSFDARSRLLTPSWRLSNSYQWGWECERRPQVRGY